MSETKTGGFQQRFPGSNGGNGQRGGPPMPRARSDRIAPEARQGNGWDAYRRWLTRVQAPGGNRIPLDPSIYTWKGYRNWTDKVRREWKPGD